MKVYFKTLVNIKNMFIFVVVSTIFFMSKTEVDAAIPNLSNSEYIRVYPLSMENDTYVYTTSSLSTRGTASPKRAYNAVIYASDEIYVYSMDNFSAYISYPTSYGRKYGYISVSAITPNNYSQNEKISSAKITTYKHVGSYEYGYISKGDQVYTVAQSGNYTQVVYPVGLNYKMGWITTSSYNKYINTESNTKVCLENSTDSMMMSDQRFAVVSYMNSMASVKWTPNKSFKHWSYGNKNGNNHIWTAGTIYHGIPYSQSSRNTTLEGFKDNMSGITYYGPSGQNSYLGNDCSSAVSLAYRKVNADFPVTNTTGLYPVKGKTKKVGNYNDYGLTSSIKICNNNGKGIMENSYRQLRAGDLLLTNAGAHVMMVTGTGDGYVMVTHQTTYNSTLHSTWRIDEKWSFVSLYNCKYIPVTMAMWQ